MEIRKLVALQAGSEDFYSKAKAKGEAAHTALKNRGKSQIRNLENIANNADKVSDLLDYVKKQTARSRPNQDWRCHNFGQELVQYIETGLQQTTGRLETGLNPPPDEYEHQQIRLLLLREFIRQMGTHFLYKGV
jgi:hypothetical protein